MESARPLSYLQALVEERDVPIFAPNEREVSAQNIFMVQSSENTNDRGLILLTTPPVQQLGDPNQLGEGYSLLRLLDDAAGLEESKGNQA